MVDKPDHKHTRTIFIHPHTGDKQAKQVLQTIITNAGLGMSKSNKLATDNVRQANFIDELMRRCTVSPTTVPCDLNLYSNIRNEWNLLTVQPQPKSKPRHGLIRLKEKSQQAILICWKPAEWFQNYSLSWFIMGFQIPQVLYMMHFQLLPGISWFLASDRPKE